MGLIVIAVFIVILNVFARSIMNEVPRSPIDVNQWRSKKAEAILSDPQLNKTPQQKILIGFYRGLACSIIGQSCTNQTKDSVSHSLIGQMGTVSTYALKNPPASGVREVYAAATNIGLAPNIYAAQGIGFGSIAGFRPVWKIFRDIAYGVLVLVMVVISFMIMFRMKLNAQTAISIESALPRIVLSLILITFSYSIAGFLIDAMYVVMGVAITLLCSNNTYCTASTKINEYLNAGMANVWQGFFPYQGAGSNLPEFISMIFIQNQAGRAVFHLANSLIGILPNALQAAVLFIGSIANLAIVNFVVALGSNSQFFELTKNFQAFTFSFGGLPPALIGGLIVGFLMSLTFITTPLIIALIIFLTLVFLFFRIFFMLFSSFLNILFMIIFAPVFMLFEAIPGQNSFSYWIRNMIGELLTFPLLAVFLMVGALIVNNFQFIEIPHAVVEWQSATIWQPPFLSGWSGGAEQQSFLMIIGMGIIFITPDLIKMVKELLGVKPPPVNIGLGTFLAGGALAWGGGMGLMGSAFKWSGMMYGTDAAGRKAGLQGKMGKMFSPMKEAFVKRSAPGQPEAAEDREDRVSKRKSELTGSDWDTVFETKYGEGDKKDEIIDVKPKLDANNQPVKRKEKLWKWSAEGQQQQKNIDFLADKKVKQELEQERIRREAYEIAAENARIAAQNRPAQTNQQPAQQPGVEVRESGIAVPTSSSKKPDPNPGDESGDGTTTS